MKSQRIQKGSRGHRIVQLLLALAAASTIWYVATLPDYRIILFSQVVVYAVAILGFAIVAGYSGQLSLSQSAFLGIGAYTSAILTSDHGWPFFATLPVSGGLCLIVGLLVGIPALRVRGLYLALVTLTLAVVFPVIVERFSMTGGASGKPVLFSWSTPSWFPLSLSDAGWQFVVISVVAACLYFLAAGIIHSRVGRAFIAVRDNEVAASVTGIPVARYKTLAFGISALYGGIAGSLLTLVSTIISPDSVGFSLTILLVTGLVIGGMSSIYGSIVGGLVVVWLPYFASEWGAKIPFVGDQRANALSTVIYAGLLMVIIYVMPGGVARGLHRLSERIVRISPVNGLHPPGQGKDITRLRSESRVERSEATIPELTKPPYPA